LAPHEHPVLQGDRVRLRPSSERDLDTLSEWFATRANFRWWGGRALGRDEVAAKYIGRRCPTVEAFIVESDGRAIGYAQYHLEGPNEAGLDMLLLPEFRGRGLGPEVASVMINHLRAVLGVVVITADPMLDNDRAIAAWLKAHFVIEHAWPDHPGGPALLMRHVPSGPAS
jgi:aminoglycoside 6'-N-acetyltransferase